MINKPPHYTQTQNTAPGPATTKLQLTVVVIYTGTQVHNGHGLAAATAAVLSLLAYIRPRTAAHPMSGLHRGEDMLPG